MNEKHRQDNPYSVFKTVYFVHPDPVEVVE